MTRLKSSILITLSACAIGSWSVAAQAVTAPPPISAVGTNSDGLFNGVANNLQTIKEGVEFPVSTTFTSTTFTSGIVQFKEAGTTGASDYIVGFSRGEGMQTVRTITLVSDTTGSLPNLNSVERLLGLQDLSLLASIDEPSGWKDLSGNFSLAAGSVWVASDPVATPIPAALSLFAGGLGILGVVGGRKRRNSRPAAAA